MTALHLAAGNGQLVMVQHILQAGADIHAVNSHGRTALMLAAEAGHADVVEELTDAGAPVSTADSVGTTALLLAASDSSKGHTKSLPCLLSEQADIYHTDAAGSSPLIAAVKAGNAGSVRVLLSWRPPPKQPSSRLSSTVPSQGDSGLLCWINMKDSAGDTALHVAARSGFLQAAQLLISYGASVDCRTTQGDHTPLHLTVRAGNEPMVEFLLQHMRPPRVSFMYTHEETGQGNVNAAIPNGETALHYAVRSGHAAIVARLLAAGADANSCCRVGDKYATPLILADQHQQRDILQLLVKDVVSNLKGPDSTQRTWAMPGCEHGHALEWAVEGGRIDVIRALPGAAQAAVVQQLLCWQHTEGM